MCLNLCVLWCLFFFFFFKQKTAYEMRISDWSSDVCSSDLACSKRADNNCVVASQNQINQQDLSKSRKDRRIIEIGKIMDDARPYFRRSSRHGNGRCSGCDEIDHDSLTRSSLIGSCCRRNLRSSWSPSSCPAGTP